jgi:hypothetical protein
MYPFPVFWTCWDVDSRICLATASTLSVSVYSRHRADDPACDETPVPTEQLQARTKPAMIGFIQSFGDVLDLLGSDLGHHTWHFTWSPFDCGA